VQVTRAVSEKFQRKAYEASSELNSRDTKITQFEQEAEDRLLSEELVYEEQLDEAKTLVSELQSQLDSQTQTKEKETTDSQKENEHVDAEHTARKYKEELRVENEAKEKKYEDQEARFLKLAKRGQALLLKAQQGNMDDVQHTILMQWAFAARLSQMEGQLSAAQNDGDAAREAVQQALKERQHLLQQEADAAQDMFSRLALAEEKERVAQEEALNAAPPERLRTEIEELRRKNVELLARGSSAAFGASAKHTPADWRAIGTVAEVIAGDDVTKIGLGFRSMPPDPLIIKKVVPGDWAESAGVLPGDAILELSGTLVGNMNQDSFKEMMKMRPLIIKIWRIAKRY